MRSIACVLLLCLIAGACGDDSTAADSGTDSGRPCGPSDRDVPDACTQEEFRPYAECTFNACQEAQEPCRESCTAFIECISRCGCSAELACITACPNTAECSDCLAEHPCEQQHCDIPLCVGR